MLLRAATTVCSVVGEGAIDRVLSAVLGGLLATREQLNFRCRELSSLGILQSRWPTQRTAITRANTKVTQSGRWVNFCCQSSPLGRRHRLDISNWPVAAHQNRLLPTEAVWKRFSSCQLQRNSLVRITLGGLHFDLSKRGSLKAVWAARIGPEVRYGPHEGLSRPSPAPLSWSAGSPGFA